MDINDKMLNDLASRMGIGSGAMERAEGMAEGFKGKSETELLSEIMKLKQNMKKDPAAYRKQIRALRSLSTMMNQEQKTRLNRVLQLLEEDN